MSHGGYFVYEVLQMIDIIIFIVMLTAALCLYVSYPKEQKYYGIPWEDAMKKIDKMEREEK